MRTTQRHARLVGLDDRGQVVRGRRAARARHRGRPAALLGHAEGEEARDALVDVRPRRQARLARQREHERRRARARRGAGSGQAAARQLVDEGAQQQVGVGRLGQDARPMPTTVVLLHGFAGTGRAWDPVVARLDPERYTAAGARPARPRRRARRAAGELRRLRRRRAGRAPDALRPVRLLDGRADRPARRAGGARARRAPAARRHHGGHRGRGRARGAPRRRRAPSPPSPTTATIEQFADRWAAQPLFAGTPPDAARIWREDLLRNDPRALAAVAARASAAARWRRCGSAWASSTMPATVLVGERDTKFVALGRAAGRRASRRRARRRRQAPGIRPAARGAGGDRGGGGLLDAEPGLHGDGDRARRSTGQHGQLVGEQLERPQPARPRSVFSAAAQWTAAAMPSGPSKVEAR